LRRLHFRLEKAVSPCRGAWQSAVQEKIRHFSLTTACLARLTPWQAFPRKKTEAQKMRNPETP
jgi:hypothetical protein